MKLLISISFVTAFLLSGCGSSSSETSFNDSKYDKSNKNDQWDLSKSAKPSFSLSTGGDIKDFTSIIYPNHPRLYFRDSDKQYLKTRMDSREWKVIEKSITSELLFYSGISYEDAKERLNKLFEDTDYPRLLAFYAYMTQKKEYKDLIIKWAVEELASDSSSMDDLVRPKIARLAEIYDWFYSDLNKEQKSIIRRALVNNINIFMSLDQAKDPNFIQSHSRWGHGVVAQGLLAMYGDFDLFFTKSYADYMLEDIRKLFLNYQNVERYIATDGGWHLGWMYAYYYADYSFNYLVWSSATKETMLDDWMGNVSYWYIYGLKSDNTFPIMGDATVNDGGMNLGEYAALYQSKYQNDSYAKLFLKNLQKTDYYYENHNYFMRFILGENEIKSDASFSSLPLSRHFENSGVVIAKDNWDKNSTMLIFKSSPFYSAGHHHRDENSFTIDYKASLAVDSGYYDGTDLPHYVNYYTRTIAHNAITVYNPNQKYYYNVHYNTEIAKEDKVLPNDGGQIYQKHDPVTVDDIKTSAKLDGITKYYTNYSYTYMQGDATKAYSPENVSLEKRDILYLKDSGTSHPITIVYDRVESTDPSFQKRYLLHSESTIKPTIKGDKTTSVTDVYDLNDDESYSYKESVKMINVSLYPKDASLKVVGNVDKLSSKAYPYYDGKVVDTAPDPKSGMVRAGIKNYQVKTGNWRLEVAPKTGKKYDQILNVIFVGDETQKIDTDIALVESYNTLGVMLKERVILFSKDKNDARSFEYTISKGGTFRHTLISGYKEGDSVNVEVNGKVVKKANVKKDGCIDFTLESKTIDRIKVYK